MRNMSRLCDLWIQTTVGHLTHTRNCGSVERTRYSSYNDHNDGLNPDGLHHNTIQGKFCDPSKHDMQFLCKVPSISVFKLFLHSLISIQFNKNSSVVQHLITIREF